MKPVDNHDRQAMLLGVGLDSDGHRRITQGENFYLAGGTEETHGRMAETVIKFNEKLARRGKKLHDLSREEFRDLMGEASDR
ncbi:MAG: hypothetical protein E7041_02815 [Lentisphaerae bacterium]|nr:hypothetical protein [Lentisphaerota bacterium]MBQ9804531.1 hypothetical protein [Lentisphaeria bacterium]